MTIRLPVPGRWSRLAIPILALPLLMGLFLSPARADDDGDDGSMAFTPVQSGTPRTVEVSPEGQRAIGLQTIRVSDHQLDREISAPGRIEADALTSYDITAQVPARVVKILIQSGDRVAAGQPLAVLSAPELGQAQADLISQLSTARGEVKSAESALRLSEENLRRQRQLLLAGTAADKDVQAEQATVARAQAMLETAERQKALAAQTFRARLQTLGMGDAQIDRMLTRRQISDTITLDSPGPGVVTVQQLTVGQNVAPADKLFTVTDTRHVWAVADVYPSDLDQIRLGEPMEIGLPDRTQKIRATVDYIGASVDPLRHTVPVRATLDAPGGEFKPGMYVGAKILTGQTAPVLAIPETGIVTISGVPNAWLQVGADRFHREPLVIGRQSEGWVEVKDGLKVGDSVVTVGSFMLRAQAIKTGGAAVAADPDAVGGDRDGDHDGDHDKVPGFLGRIPGFAYALVGLLALLAIGALVFRFESSSADYDG